MNSNLLTSDVDMGGDGSSSSVRSAVPLDEYGYSLGYFNEDYRGVGEGNANYNDWLLERNNHSVFSSNALHNGNISHVVTSIKRFIDAGEQPLLMGYTYDQLNRIKSSRKYISLDPTFTLNTWSPGAIEDYYTSYDYDKNGNIQNLVRNGYSSGTLGDHLMDDIHYEYLNGNNQLTKITDQSGDVDVMDEGVLVSKYPNALENATSNYTYDPIGNLTSDSGENILEIKWNVSGKVTHVIKEDEVNPEDDFGPDLEFKYDASGNRVVKIVKHGEDQNTWTYTYYMRDASGNVMATYDKSYSDYVGGECTDMVTLNEHHMYGSSRVGLSFPKSLLAQVDITATIVNNEFSNAVYSNLAVAQLDVENGSYIKGDKQYEFANHLGNVLVVLSDKVSGNETLDESSYHLSTFNAHLLSAQNYYPFGMVMPGCADGSQLDQLVVTEEIILEDAYNSTLEGWEACNFGVPTLTNNGTMKIDGAVITADLTEFLTLLGTTDGEFFEQVCARKILSGNEQLSSGLDYRLILDMADLSIPEYFQLHLKLIGDGTPVRLDYPINEGMNEFLFTADQNVTEVQFSVGFEIGNGDGAVTNADMTAFLSALGDLTYSIEIDNTEFIELDETTVSISCPLGSYASINYRYGFQGQEQDDEVAGEGNSNTAHFWQYDTRLARRWNRDPKPNFSISDYAVFGNNPIFYTDLLGDTIRGYYPTSGPRTVGVIKSSFEGDETADLRNLFQLENDGITFKSIDEDLFVNAVAGLSQEQISLAYGYYLAINSTDLHLVEVNHIGEDLSQDALSSGMGTTMEELTLNIGDGFNRQTGLKSTYTLLLFETMNSKTYFNHEQRNSPFPEDRVSKIVSDPGETLAHEMIGHGMHSLIESVNAGHGDAIRTSNLYRRANGKRVYYRNGTQHGPKGTQLSHPVANQIPSMLTLPADLRAKVTQIQETRKKTEDIIDFLDMFGSSSK